MALDTVFKSLSVFQSEEAERLTSRKFVIQFREEFIAILRELM